MRLPTLSKRLNLRSAPGLSNLLVGMNNVNEAVQRYTCELENGETVWFGVLVSGDIPPNPSELLGSERTEQLMRRLREHYDYVVLDLPPVTAVTDAMIASKLVDGMLVVVRSNHAIRSSLAETIRQLKMVDTHILGFVFNGAGDGGSGYYRGKRHSRYYKGKNYESSYYKK